MIKTERSLGNVSLGIAVSGFGATAIALRQGWISGPAWEVLAQAFEAATIGGLADWFAVTALFREVPLPLIRRHTNIIINNRSRIVAGVADWVQNRLLAPSVIKEYLAGFSASRFIVDYLGSEAWTENVLSVLKDLIGQVARGLHAPEVVTFLDRALKDQLHNQKIAVPLGRFLAKWLRSGDHHHVWETILSALEKAVRGPEAREFAHRILVRSLNEYKERRILRSFAVDAARWLDIVNEEEMVSALLSKIQGVIHEAHHNPQHPLRVKLDGTLLEFADNLAAGDSDAVSMVEKLQTALIEGTDAQEILRNALQRLSQTVDEQLSLPDSDLVRLMRRIFQERLGVLRGDPDGQKRLDAWVQSVAIELVERHHDAIGEMVCASLQSLSDDALIAQIEGKIGRDLQYIRLNGAIVGGLVGAMLAIARFLGN